jgi:hypothetical protein
MLIAMSKPQGRESREGSSMARRKWGAATPDDLVAQLKSRHHSDWTPEERREVVELARADMVAEQ